MSLFDRFKKNEAPKKAVKTAGVKREDKPTAAPAAVTVRQELQAKAPAGKAPRVDAHRILLRPVITEKSATLHALNKYIFEISSTANKIDVRKAIRQTYHVEPSSIRIIRVAGKEVRRGRIVGRTSSYKKAIITLPSGSKLPIYEGV